MRAGALDRRVRIEYPVTSLDATYGTPVISWAELVTAPAEVVDFLPSRSESVRQGLAQARNQTRIRMRWRDDVTSDMRAIVLGERGGTYQIVGGPAESAKRKGWIELVCERYSSPGGS